MTPTTQQGKQHFYDWHGSAYEIGLQHGQALREEIIREYLPALQSLIETSGQNEAQLLEGIIAQYEPIFERYVPGTLDEIQGLADGSGLDYRHAFFAAIRDGMKSG